MLKSRFLRSGLVMFLFGTFGLFSCSQNASVSSNDNPGELTGSVEVTLPNLSNGALSKSAALLDTNSLNLLITGDNMDTIKYSWPINRLRGQKVVINGIPTGANRYFSGFLTNSIGTITHTGKVAATITWGAIVPVTLKLSATGSVNLCIVIEGYPSSCNETDSITINSCVKVYRHDDTLDGNMFFVMSNYNVRGYIGFTDTIPKTFTFDTLFSRFDSAGIKVIDLMGHCKETGENVMYELQIRNGIFSGGYIGYTYSTHTSFIYSFYPVECTQLDTTVLAGRLYAYTIPSSIDTVIDVHPEYRNDTMIVTNTSIAKDTSMAYMNISIYNGRAHGYLNIFSFDNGDTLHLDMFGNGKVYQDKRNGDFMVSTQDTTGCIYTLTMNFNQDGEFTYCKGSLDRNGELCSPGNVVLLSGNLH